MYERGFIYGDSNDFCFYRFVDFYEASCYMNSLVYTKIGISKYIQTRYLIISSLFEKYLLLQNNNI